MSVMRHVASPPDRGSAMMLMPAAFLVVLLLGSIALDFGLLHARQREIYHLADGAANDAASYAVDTAVLRSLGCIALRPDAATAAAQASIGASGIADVQLDGVELTVIDDLPAVVVNVSLEAQLILAPAVPGGSSTRHLEATATAQLFDADTDFTLC